MRRRCGLLHIGRQLRQRRHCLLQIAGRLLGSCRQILIARGNFLAGGRDIAAGVTHLSDHAAQRLPHLLQRTLQLGQLVIARHRLAGGKIATFDGQRHLTCALQRSADGLHVQQRQRHHHDQRQDHRAYEHPARLRRHLQLGCNQRIGLLIQQSIQLRQQLVGFRDLGQCLAAHAVGRRGRVVAARLQLARHRLESLTIVVYACGNVLGQLVILRIAARHKARQGCLGLSMKPTHCSWALRTSSGRSYWITMSFSLMRIPPSSAQLRHIASLGIGVVQKILAHLLDAEHAQHACPSQQSQQHNHHADRPQHSRANGEAAHHSQQTHESPSRLV